MDIVGKFSHGTLCFQNLATDDGFHLSFTVSVTTHNCFLKYDFGEAWRDNVRDFLDGRKLVDENYIDNSMQLTKKGFDLCVLDDGVSIDCKIPFDIWDDQDILSALIIEFEAWYEVLLKG